MKLGTTLTIISLCGASNDTQANINSQDTAVKPVELQTAEEIAKHKMLEEHRNEEKFTFTPPSEEYERQFREKLHVGPKVVTL